MRGDKNKNGDYESYLFTLRLAILQQSYGRFGGAERLAFSHYAHMIEMANLYVTHFVYQNLIGMDEDH